MNQNSNGLFLPFTVAAILILNAMVITACGQEKKIENNKEGEMNFNINKSDEDWRKLLTPVQFNVLREKGTERAFTGEYDKFYEEGTYYCVGCGHKLFNSKTKFNSGCGWPSFYEPSESENIIEKRDLSYGMIRTEIMCANCGGHLGHVFDDGPKPTGQRYCINSASLEFKPKEKE